MDVHGPMKRALKEITTELFRHKRALIMLPGVFIVFRAGGVGGSPWLARVAAGALGEGKCPAELFEKIRILA